MTRRTSKRLHPNTKMLGYKVMRFEDGRAVSAADSRHGFGLRKGRVIQMPGVGVFLSTDRQFVLKYYTGLTDDREVLLTLEFDPKNILTGRETMNDRESVLTVSAAKIVDFEILENE